MEIITRKELQKRIENDLIQCCALSWGIAIFSLVVSSFFNNGLTITSFALHSIILLTSGLLPKVLLHNDKIKSIVNRKVLKLEKKQSLIIEYNKNPHKFVKHYLGINDKDKANKLVDSIRKEYINSYESGIYEFEKMYNAISRSIGNNNNLKGKIEWK